MSGMWTTISNSCIQTNKLVHSILLGTWGNKFRLHQCLEDVSQLLVFVLVYLTEIKKKIVVKIVQEEDNAVN